MGVEDEDITQGRTVAMPGDADVDDSDATVLASTAPDPDPDATVLAEAPDPEATMAAPLADAPDDLPTIVVPKGTAPATPAEGPDGIDAMDDPYYMPAVPDDLTSARAPMSIPSPVQSLPERKRRLPRWALALLLVVLLAAVGGIARVTYDRELWGGKTVPSVVGMTEDQATQELSRLGFAVSVEHRPSDDGIGTVVACDPAPGMRADPAAGATIVVSSERRVPAVVGKYVDEAREALLELGAGSILLDYRNSDQASGTVLAVDPAEGEPFLSSTTITLTLARSFTVPNVVGMSVAEARQVLADEGLEGSVVYVESSAEGGTVVSTNPAVSEQVGQGATVELEVASAYPSSPRDLLGYFDAAPVALADYLEREGFTRVFGEVFAASGNAHAAYVNDAGDLVKVTDEPELGSYASASTADTLRSGAGVGGVRYVFSASSLPSGASEETDEGVKAVMRACGLTGMGDVCTADDAVMPDVATATAPDGEEADGEQADEPAAHFICATGQQGDWTWAVFIGGLDDTTKVVALVAPSVHFSSMDLSAYGNSVCDYVAYSNLYR